MNLFCEIWTVYDRPLDFPHNFVARKFVGIQPTESTITGNSLEEVRAGLPPGVVKLDRAPDDDPKIVEVWL